MFSNSWFTICNNYVISWCVKNTLVSSGNIIVSNMFEAVFKSLRIKEIGMVLKLNLVEQHSWLSLNFVFLFHLFKWIASYREFLTYPLFLSIMPYSSIFFLIRMEWSTVSRAFFRSINAPSLYLLFSKDSVIWSSYCTTAWSVEWPFWKSIF